MSDGLPPFAAIRVFEAAARHLSFTKAAIDLGMTQAAVSYQIKLLEERLGTTLFLRAPRRLSLTEAGAALAPKTTEAMDILREAFSGFQQANRATLTISTIQSFATQWLVPRLGAFQTAHPEIAVDIETTGRLIDFAREDVDVAIRTGGGEWEGLTSTRLFDIDFAPMLSPKLEETIGGVKTPADILRLPLLDVSDPWWQIWFRANDLPLDQPVTPATPSFNVQSFDAKAALEGKGVALLTPSYFESELATGRLLQPFKAIKADGSFWLTFPEARRSVPKIRTFRAWIAAEVEKLQP